MNRIFRELNESEITKIKPNLIELYASEGWLLTESDRTLLTEVKLLYLPNETYINRYMCVKEEIVESSTND